MVTRSKRIWESIACSQISLPGRALWTLLALLLFNFSAAAQFPQPPGRTTNEPAATCSMLGLTQEARRGLNRQTLVDAYNAQAALVHSLRASTIVRARAGSEYAGRVRDSQPTPAMLAFHAPASLRVTGVVPFSARRSFDLSSDGAGFRLLVPDGKLMHLFAGPVDAPATSSNPRENLRPQPILDALHWLPARLVSAPAPAISRDRSQAIEVELTDSSGAQKSAQLEFDLTSGTLSRLTLDDKVGQSLTEVVYGDWQKVPNGGNGRQVCFPRRILVIQKQPNRELEMKFLSVEINVQIQPSEFRLIPPQGIPVTRVGNPSAGNPDHP